MKNSGIRVSLPVGLWLCAQLLAIPSNATAQPFTTVINVPPDVAPGSIGSDTQLNLADGGSLGILFDAGDTDGTGSNTEVNILGGTVGGHFQAHPGSTVNISGGLVGLAYFANSDSTTNISGGIVGFGLQAGVDEIGSSSTNVLVNITGGTIGDRLLASSGSTINMSDGAVGSEFFVLSGGTANISGGTIGDAFRALEGSTVNISGGTFGDGFHASNNSTVHISGGVLGSGFNSRIMGGSNIIYSGGRILPDITIFQSANITLVGGEFKVNGVPVPDLNAIGDSTTINLHSDLVNITGTLQDGSAYISPTQLRLANISFTLAALPVATDVFNLPADQPPKGLRVGQTLNLTAGGVLEDYFQAVDATLNINGGTTGKRLEVANTTVNLSSGSIGEDFIARSNSIVNISGGSVDRFFSTGELNSDSNNVIVNISGGTVADISAERGATVNVSGGVTGVIGSRSGSLVNIIGGDVGGLFISDGRADITGGNLDGIFSVRRGTVNLTGSSFILNGVDLTPGLTPGELFTITDRNVRLEGVLVDGSPFGFDLTSTFANFVDFFDPGATLTVTLVPEPGTMVMVGAGGLALMKRRRVG